MFSALLLANLELPSNLLFWGGCALVAYLLFWNGTQTDPPREIAATELLPFEPPAKLQPKTKAIDQLHAVGDYLDAQGRGAEAAAHLDALAVLINRRG